MFTPQSPFRSVDAKKNSWRVSPSLACYDPSFRTDPSCSVKTQNGSNHQSLFFPQKCYIFCYLNPQFCLSNPHVLRLVTVRPSWDPHLLQIPSAASAWNHDIHGIGRRSDGSKWVEAMGSVKPIREAKAGDHLLLDYRSVCTNIYIYMYVYIHILWVCIYIIWM